MDKAALYAFCAKSRYATLASVSASGAPQSALIGIAVTEDLEIVFDTLRSSRKYQNLTENPSCSLVIGWTGQQTVQYEGLATQPQGDELTSYLGIYFATWPDGPERLTWPGITHFVVRPRWIRYSDYAQSPPLIEETAFP